MLISPRQLGLNTLFTVHCLKSKTSPVGNINMFIISIANIVLNNMLGDWDSRLHRLLLPLATCKTLLLVRVVLYDPLSLNGTDNQEDGTVVFALPMKSLDATFPICDIEHDIGPVVKAVFDLGPEANGKLFPIVSEFIKAHPTVHSFVNNDIGQERCCGL
jgi:hypothetical protein